MRSKAIYTSVVAFIAVAGAAERYVASDRAGQTRRTSESHAKDSEGGGACGEERWAIKTLSDPDASQVIHAPQDTTVSDLAAMSPNRSEEEKRAPVETTTYRVRAQLVGFKLEEDRDIHLIIADPQRPSKTMITELPDLTCIPSRTSRPDRTRMAKARATLVAAVGEPSRRFEDLNRNATITGVAFFDTDHGQRGIADNGIELHPLVDVQVR